MVPVDPQPWVQHLVKHIPIAIQGEDPEGVHQIRVASRRLRVWMRIARRRILVDDLRWFRNTASEVRDLDVLLEGEQPAAFADWLRTRRAEAREGLVRALRAPRASALMAGLRVLPPIPAQLAQARIAQLTRKVRRAAEVLREESPNIERLHDLRKRVRVLRYALEWLGHKPREIKSLQDHLGWLGDLRVATTWYEAWPERDAHPAIGASMEERIAAGIIGSREAWEIARPVLTRRLAFQDAD